MLSSKITMIVEARRSSSPTNNVEEVQGTYFRWYVILEASARQLDTSRLGRVSRHYCARPATKFFFSRAFVVGCVAYELAVLVGLLN
jgi:hypothetical protein